MTRSRTRRRILAAALVVALSPALAGCFSGFRATTNVQATTNSGNGTEAEVGDIHVENATLVLGPERSATLIMRLVNTGTTQDALTSVQINGSDALVTGSPVPLPPGSSVPFGYEGPLFVNTYDLDVEPSAYVPVSVTLQSAGTAQLQVLTVPPVGYYEGIAPVPPTAPL